MFVRYNCFFNNGTKRTVMTTTFQPDKQAVKMNSFAGMKSLHSKMIAILYTLLVSTVSLHAQINSTSKLPPVLKVASCHKAIQATVPLKYSKYTVLLAKNFPIIKGTTQTLYAMEENEVDDLLCLSIPEKKQKTIFDAVEFVHKV